MTTNVVEPQNMFNELNEDMMVEDYIHNLVAILKHQVSVKCEQERQYLRNQLQDSKKELRLKHQELIANEELEHKDSSENNHHENVVNSIRIPIGILVEIKSGIYNGQSFQLNPRPRGPCFIGRSTGKKFLERGISLSDDLEVSTTHGKFEMKQGVIYFVDTNSTNGSFTVDGELITPNEPLKLHDGLVIRVGQCAMHITLMY